MSTPSLGQLILDWLTANRLFNFDVRLEGCDLIIDMTHGPVKAITVYDTYVGLDTMFRVEASDPQFFAKLTDLIHTTHRIISEFEALGYRLGNIKAIDDLFDC